MIFKTTVNFQAFLTEKFEAMAKTIKQGAPADTRVLGRLEQLEESERNKDEKLAKMSQQLATLMNTCTCRNGQSFTPTDDFDSFQEKVRRLEQKLDDYQMQSNIKSVLNTERLDKVSTKMELLSVDSTAKLGALENRIQPLEEFESKGKEQMDEMKQSIVALEAVDTKGKEQFSAIQQDISGLQTFETESKEQISAIQLDINGLQSFETKGEVDINEMKQGIAALETSNSEAKAQLDELDTKLMQTAVGLQASASGSGGAIAFNCYRTSE